MQQCSAADSERLPTPHGWRTHRPRVADPTAHRGDPRGTRSRVTIRTPACELSRNGWLSDQHGAWTLAFPPLCWALSFTFSWLVVLMLLAWAMAFQMFSAVCLWVKTPGEVPQPHRARDHHLRTPRGRSTGITLLAMRPQLLWWAIAFAPLASSAIYLVWQGRERSLGARSCLGILAGSIMGPVAFSLATAEGSPVSVTLHAWATCVAFGLHYIATVPLVRSMIRGRKDPRCGSHCTRRSRSARPWRGGSARWRFGLSSCGRRFARG